MSHHATDVVEMPSENISHLADGRSGTVGSKGQDLANAVQLENLIFL
jgi:hypothetical protein